MFDTHLLHAVTYSFDEKMYPVSAFEYDLLLKEYFINISGIV